MRNFILSDRSGRHKSPPGNDRDGGDRPLFELWGLFSFVVGGVIQVIEEGESFAGDRD